MAASETSRGQWILVVIVKQFLLKALLCETRSSSQKAQHLANVNLRKSGRSLLKLDVEISCEELLKSCMDRSCSHYAA